MTQLRNFAVEGYEWLCEAHAFACGVTDGTNKKQYLTDRVLVRSF